MEGAVRDGCVRASWESSFMETNTPSAEAENIVRLAARTILTPDVGECLVCYVDRQLRAFGCDGTHRFAQQYRDASAPRSTALVKRLARVGACCCDCEIFLNACEPAFALWTEDRWVDDPEQGEVFVESQPPAVMPACTGVPRGAVDPCRNWARAAKW